MSYTHSEITFPSSDGIHTIYGDIFAPQSRYPRAIVQLAHGMKDYCLRYSELASFLCERGFVFAGNNHLGHYKSANGDADLGFFADRDGVRYVLKDMHAMNKLLRAKYPGIPLIIMGHSMGSFLARLYVNKHPHGIDAAIIHGTGGPNGAVALGHLVGAVISLFRTPRYRSELLAKLTFMGYNSHFPKSEGPHAWLTRDLASVAPYKDDPYSSFTFTVSAYRDLFRMLSRSNAQSWFFDYPKGLPTLIMSGTEDPVGGYGKGVSYVYKHLLLAGVSDVRLKLYEGARHELFHETNKNEVFADILSFLEGVCR